MSENTDDYDDNDDSDASASVLEKTANKATRIEANAIKVAVAFLSLLCVLPTKFGLLCQKIEL